jgi:hypothetical protein
LPEIHAEALNHQLEFLKAKLEELKNKPGENPYPRIFKDSHAYVFFQELQKSWVNVEKRKYPNPTLTDMKKDKKKVKLKDMKNVTLKDTLQADYGYIYYRMHNSNLFAINEPVKKNHFCDFLREINVPLPDRISTLPNTKNTSKTATLKLLLEKYLLNSKSELDPQIILEKIL